jgi:uncharacterized protein
MNEETLEAFLVSFIASSPGPIIQIVWHGGEPTLAGLSFYRKAVELERKHLPEGWEIWNNLQTNGLLLDDEWCTFLNEEGFDVGLSVDGSKWLHDKNRTDLGGRPTYKKVSQACALLRKHGIKPDLLCTVTQETAEKPLAAYQSLKGLGTGWMQFIPIVIWGEGGRIEKGSVSALSYGKFLCAVFDEWATHDIGRIGVQLFAEMSLVLRGVRSSVCWMAPTCGRVAVVEVDGSVYSCDHFVNEGHRIGSVFEGNLARIVDSDAQTRFGREKKEGLSQKCLSCEWAGLCNGGCPKDWADLDGQKVNCLCEGLRYFYAHSVEPLKRILGALDREEPVLRVQQKMRAELGKL